MCGFQRHDRPGGVIAVARVDLDLDHRHTRLRLLHRPVEVFTDDHACTGAHDADRPGVEPVGGLPDHADQHIMGAEDVVRVAHGRGDYSHAIFFQQPGMLKAAPWRPMQHCHVHVQVPQRIKCRHNGAGPRLYDPVIFQHRLPPCLYAGNDHVSGHSPAQRLPDSFFQAGCVQAGHRLQAIPDQHDFPGPVFPQCGPPVPGPGHRIRYSVLRPAPALSAPGGPGSFPPPGARHSMDSPEHELSISTRPRIESRFILPGMPSNPDSAVRNRPG